MIPQLLVSLLSCVLLILVRSCTGTYVEINLVLNWEKYHFMVQEGIVLCHKISRLGIQVDQAKVTWINPPYTLISIKWV